MAAAAAAPQTQVPPPQAAPPGGAKPGVGPRPSLGGISIGASVPFGGSILSVIAGWQQHFYDLSAKYKIDDPKQQRRVVLVIVSAALLLDNMLYMVIVPIIPDYLRKIGAWKTHTEGGRLEFRNVSGKLMPLRIGGTVVYENEDSAIGVLFSSKATVQLLTLPFSGHFIDRIGYDIPMMIGLSVMFLSTSVFACGQSYSLLFFARSLQGVGSAFADTAGLAMIADRFTEEQERQRALGIAIAFISFGSLVAPPFGGILYEIAGKEVPFIILALICLLDGVLLLFVMTPVKEQMAAMGIQRPKGTPIHVLFKDKYIAYCAGALVMANVSLAFLEPTISIWMEDTMHVEEWQIGLVWLPSFFPHVFGVYLTVRLMDKYPRHEWFIAAFGLALEGISCVFIPFTDSYFFLFIPIAVLCFGIAAVDTSLLPLLGYLVDTRYVSVYGSIYAIADISYSLAYSIGPIIAGTIVEMIGFTALNFAIAISNLAYLPIFWKLKHVYDYNPFEEEGAQKPLPPGVLPPPNVHYTAQLPQQQGQQGTNGYAYEGQYVQGAQQDWNQQQTTNPFLSEQQQQYPQQPNAYGSTNDTYELRGSYSTTTTNHLPQAVPAYQQPPQQGSYQADPSQGYYYDQSQQQSTPQQTRKHHSRGKTRSSNRAGGQQYGSSDED